MEQGDPIGRPVIYLHSYLDGPRLFDNKIDLLKKNNWRIIAPSRPGYGKSSPIKIESPLSRLENFSKDIEELSKHLNLGKSIIAGQNYALYFASTRPNYTTGLLLHNGVPIWDSLLEEKMTQRRRNLAKTFRKWPGSTRLMVGLCISLINSGKANIFLRGLAKGSQRNLELLNNPQFLEHAIYECRHNVEQGAETFLSDIPIMQLNMQKFVDKLHVPVAISQYKKEAHIPNEAVEMFIKALPYSRVFWSEGLGAESYDFMNIAMNDGLEFLYNYNRNEEIR